MDFFIFQERIYQNIFILSTEKINVDFYIIYSFYEKKNQE